MLWPIPRNFVEDLKYQVQQGSILVPVLMAFPNEAVAAIWALVTIGRDAIVDPEYDFSIGDFSDELMRSRDFVNDAPLHERSKLAAFTHLQAFIEEGLKIADGVGLRWISTDEYWASSPGQHEAQELRGQPTSHQYGNGESDDSATVRTTGDYRESVYTFHTRVRPTEEQGQILEASRKAGSTDVVKAEAFAGTGKTTLCGFIGEELGSGSAVYLAFNRDMADQAKRRLGGTVEDCRTSDSLAYKVVKPSNQWGEERCQRGQSMPWHDLADRLGLPQMFGIYRRGILVRQVDQTVKNYCYSAEPELSLNHVPELEWPTGGNEQVLQWAKNLWAMMILKSGDLPIFPHQVMKWWDLREGTIPYDVVLFDEAQDANGAFMSILRRSSCKRILIGDHHQQLYDWRGAVNAMAQIEGSSFPLTQSWRFGPEIADYANKVLGRKSNVPAQKMRGNLGLSSQIITYGGSHQGPEWPITILARTNTGVFRQAVSVAEFGHRFHLVGGIEDLQWLMLDALRLYRGGANRGTPHPTLVRFGSWDDLVFEEEQTMDSELRRVRETIEERHSVLEGQLATLGKHHVAVEAKAPIVLSTTHRVKGREWPRVMLMDDFINRDKLDETTDGEYRDAELNVLYVAATRATRELYIPECLQMSS
ncbi:ATP-binding domain-containing protein [Pelagibius litoralis]|uniref:ATP-binding domain-containing protein n=1 Tax=Pelagibius litoralis TaxID=374515 RepID=A0A967EZQ0_9PROT|nr:ATP-binding domain-containing protein [Pelagibius litoralis]NIA70354.1 ATP-binding domain-containing protein [Pelagibius litoralis]